MATIWLIMPISLLLINLLVGIIDLDGQLQQQKAIIPDVPVPSSATSRMMRGINVSSKYVDLLPKKSREGRIRDEAGQASGDVEMNIVKVMLLHES